MKAVCMRLLGLLLSAAPCVCVTASAQEPRTLFIVFMAARNDLYPYAGRNIKQLQAGPHAEHVGIFVRLDAKKPGKEATTKQFFIDHNNLKPIGPQEYQDSGDEDALVETIQRAYTAYPADHVVLVIWNHGTGGVEPAVLKALNPSDLFFFNAKKNRIELERSIGFMEYITQGSPYNNETKGIGFDDSSGNYLTVKKLTSALERASTTVLKKKFAVVACDACMMAGIDVIAGFKNLVDYFVGSQEVVLGTGYNYDNLLKPLLAKKIVSMEQFAAHCVTSFEETYGKVTEDYTHSALEGSFIQALENNLDALARTLIKGLELPEKKSIKALIRKSRHKTVCTYFKEPTYIDIDNFYENLLENSRNWPFAETDENRQFKQNLTSLLQESRTIIKHMVKANAVGKNLKRARGISIYFPQYIIHPSYFNNSFASEKTQWLEFLKKYIAT